MKTPVRLTLRVATLFLAAFALWGGASPASAQPVCKSNHKCWDTWFGDDACYINQSTVGWACYMAGTECIQDPHVCLADQ
jgi:hypothetical protein